MADEVGPSSSGSSPGSNNASSGRSGPKVPLIAGAIVAALIAAFWFQNGGPKSTQVDFVVFEKYTTVRWVVITSLILGILLDRALSIWWRRRKAKKAAG